MPVALGAKETSQQFSPVIMPNQTVHACYCMLFSTILFLWNKCRKNQKICQMAEQTAIENRFLTAKAFHQQRSALPVLSDQSSA